jgi:hypothetical protein
MEVSKCRDHCIDSRLAKDGTVSCAYEDWLKVAFQPHDQVMARLNVHKHPDNEANALELNEGERSKKLTEGEIPFETRFEKNQKGYKRDSLPEESIEKRLESSGHRNEEKIVKKALTAFSFGARLSEHGWYETNGDYKRPSLATTITNMDERKRFMESPTIKKFVAEQKLLDQYIYKKFTETYPHLLKMPELQTSSGRASKSKVMAWLYQNAEMATKFVPVMENGKPTGKVMLQLTEDYGPKKAGTTMVQAPYKVQPEVGLHPVELYGSESPVGSSGKNIHWGNAITEVHPKPERLKGLGGKAGVAAALLGGAGAASAGEYRKAARDVGESFLPWGLTPGTLGGNEFELLEATKGKGPTITLPDSFRAGGRTRLI